MPPWVQVSSKARQGGNIFDHISTPVDTLKIALSVPNTPPPLSILIGKCARSITLTPALILNWTRLRLPWDQHCIHAHNGPVPIRLNKLHKVPNNQIREH